MTILYEEKVRQSSFKFQIQTGTVYSVHVHVVCVLDILGLAFSACIKNRESLKLTQTTV